MVEPWRDHLRDVVMNAESASCIRLLDAWPLADLCRRGGGVLDEFIDGGSVQRVRVDLVCPRCHEVRVYRAPLRRQTGRAGEGWETSLAHGHRSVDQRMFGASEDVLERMNAK